jgi:hypothetical protein
MRTGVLMVTALPVAVFVSALTRDPFAGPPALRELDLPASMSWSSRLAFVGDVDCDGCDDLAFGSDVPGILAGVTSGRTGELLYVIEQDDAPAERKPRVAPAGRFDDDFRDDLLVSLPEHLDGQGLVRVYAGGGSRVIFELAGERPEQWLGRSLDAADLDGDGVPELLLGAHGEALVVSGADGAVLAELRPAEDDPSFGVAVRFVADLDGDEVPEIAVAGAEDDSTGRRRVSIHSGAGHELLRELSENVLEPLCLDTVLQAACGRDERRLPSLDDGPARLETPAGPALVSPWYRPLGDFDGDGVDDELVRVNVREQVFYDETVRARVVVTSGATGRTLFEMAFGFPLPTVVAGGDADGDGLGDFLIRDRLYSWPECR